MNGQLLLHDFPKTNFNFEFASSSAYLVFIFAWLLMILCTLTFIVGAPVGAIICEEINNPDYIIFKEVCTDIDRICIIHRARLLPE